MISTFLDIALYTYAVVYLLDYSQPITETHRNIVAAVFVFLVAWKIIGLFFPRLDKLIIYETGKGFFPKNNEKERAP